MQRLTITLDDHTTGRRWDGDALDRLLDCIAEMGLAAACSLAGMPKRRTVLAWARRSPEWRTAMEAAQEDYARLLVDEAVERADSAECRETAACARIQADVRLKAAALIAPAVYGRERGGSDTGAVMVTLLRLAAQGIQDRRALEAVPLKPLTHQDMYTLERERVNNGLTPPGLGDAGARPGVGTNGTRETEGGGSPTHPVPPISPGPTNTPGDFSGTSYTKVAQDRLIVTVPDEVDVLSGVYDNEDHDGDEDLTPVDLDEPVPA